MDAFLIALNAVIPFLIYISYGFIARETGLVSEDFMRTWSKVCFNLFFPFVMFNSFYKIDPEMEMDFRFLVFGAVFLLLLIIALCIIVPKFVTDTTREPVIIQAIYRSTKYRGVLSSEMREKRH